jgi:hypothetical protein
MKQQRTILVTLALFLALMFSGCSMAITGSTKVQQDSFGAQKKFAIVTIASGKEFSGEKGLFQNFKKSENIKGLNTQPVLDQLMPMVRARFAQTGYYTSVPMKNIVTSKVYINLQEDEKFQKVAIFRQDMNVATGYKYFSDPQKLAKLAKDLKVDGVICVQMAFTINSVKSGVYVGPINFGKKEYATIASVSVIAYDREGAVLWKDSTTKHAEPGDKKAIVVLDLTDFGETNFEKMHPSAILIGEHAVNVIVQRFKDTMEGQKTSTFQRTKDKGTKQATGSKI